MLSGKIKNHLFALVFVTTQTMKYVKKEKKRKEKKERKIDLVRDTIA